MKLFNFKKNDENDEFAVVYPHTTKFEQINPSEKHLFDLLVVEVLIRERDEPNVSDIEMDVQKAHRYFGHTNRSQLILRVVYNGQTSTVETPKDADNLTTLPDIFSSYLYQMILDVYDKEQRRLIVKSMFDKHRDIIE